MGKCKFQKISELLERNQFIERQLWATNNSSIETDEDIEMLDMIMINEERILKLKGAD